MPAALQHELPVAVPLVKPPVVDVRGAFAILTDASEAEVLALCEFGYVWAFNIGDTGARRMELRILEASLKFWARRDWRAALRAQQPAERSPVTWPEVLALVLPRNNRPWLHGRECRRAVLCGRQHFINLIENGTLRATTYRRGPGGSPSVDREEFSAFLEKRVIGGI